MLSALAISGYRSLRDVVLPLGPLNVVTGANGSGKSNVYRGLRLLADAASGGAVATLAREGGLTSVLWAGPETISRAMQRGEVEVTGSSHRTRSLRLRLGFASDELGYAVELGLPPQNKETRELTAFANDPQIKREIVFAGASPRATAVLVERTNELVRSRSAGEGWQQIATLAANDSMLAALGDPRLAPELYVLRDRVRHWRFYDHLRTDRDAPARSRCIGTQTPVLAADGRDLAAAVQTICEIGDTDALVETIADAFSGAHVIVDHSSSHFGLLMQQPGLLRPLDAAELSDGTLRYLLWVAALLTPRPPELMVLNEPETSLHPELLPALGRLILHASRSMQIIVVTHSTVLVDALAKAPGCRRVELHKRLGETLASGFEGLERPPWRWPS